MTSTQEMDEACILISESTRGTFVLKSINLHRTFSEQFVSQTLNKAPIHEVIN